MNIRRLLLCLTLGSFAACSSDGPRGSSTVPERTVRTDDAAALPPSIASPIDVSAVIRRVELGFRSEDATFVAEHATHATRIRDGELALTPRKPLERLSGAPLSLRTDSIQRGDVQVAQATKSRVADDGSVHVERAGATEIIENDEAGLEQSWSFRSSPAGTGDLVIRIAVSGEQYTGATDAGLHFADTKTGLGFRYGNATWIDAAGARTTVVPAFAEGHIVLRVPSAALAGGFPAVLDPTVGPEFGMDKPVVQATPGETPAIACGTTSCLVVWADRRANGTNTDLYGARVDFSGTVLDPSGIPLTKATTTTDETDPQIAFDGTNYLVVFAQSGGAIYGTRVDESGTVLDAPALPINTSGFSGHPGVAVGGGNFFVVWEVLGGVSGYDIRGARMAPNGIVLDSPLPISTATNDQTTPGIAFNGTNFLVAWVDARTCCGGTRGASVYATRVDTSGNVLDGTGTNLSNTAYPTSPRVASDGTNFLVAWDVDCHLCTPFNAIFGMPVSAAGTPGALIVFHQDTTTSHINSRPRVTFGGGNYIVTWNHNASGSFQVNGARVSVGGVILDADPGVTLADAATSNQNFCDVAFDGTKLLLAWADDRAASPHAGIYATKPTTSLSSPNAAGFLVSGAANPQKSATVAFNGTNYLVAWEDSRPFSNTDIYATRVTPTGTVLDTSGISVSLALNSQTQPAAASDGTDFFVVWTDERAGIGAGDIYGTRVTAAGAVGSVTGLPIETNGLLQDSPAIAFDGTNYLVVWEDQRTDAGDVYGIRVDTTGAAVDAAAIPISTATNAQLAPSLAFDGTNYLVAWRDKRSEVNGDIYGTRLDTTGKVLDTFIPISAVVGVEQATTVASDGNGFVVFWDTNTAIRGARVGDAGNVVDPFGIDVATGANGRVSPSAAYDGSTYWVAWADSRSGATKSDVYAARVTSAGVVTDTSGIAVSTDSLTNELAPALAAGPAGTLLCAYHRFDPNPPSGAIRVRARIIDSRAATGTACSAGAQCATGNCVDGFCCDQACSGACMACSTSKKGSGANGTCGQIKNGTDPDTECAADALSCTTAVCSAGACTQQLSTGSCLIAGACYATGTPNPSDGCSTCVPATSTTTWTPKTDGAACTSDGLSCTVDACSGGTCTHALSASSCLVAGACYASGALNPGNSCEKCSPTDSQSAFTPISSCNGAGGAAGSGGATGSGGAVGSGGVVGSGGATGSGGAVGSGGANGSGGTTATGGDSSAGGAPSSGGSSSDGGAANTGGATSDGGASSGGGAETGGASSGGGTSNDAGPSAGGAAANTGGASSGSGGATTGGGAGAAGAATTGGSGTTTDAGAAGSAAPSSDTGGCGCRTAETPTNGSGALLSVLIGGALALRRRTSRRRRSAKRVDLADHGTLDVDVGAGQAPLARITRKNP
ncbi:MAG TPA: hypothetical protein VHE30_25615 [Polyangiaceae bacterium]|nr:hypothetical protein [Polyangiaceae bacterium]